MTKADSNSLPRRIRPSSEPLSDVGRELLKSPEVAAILPLVLRDYQHVINNLAAVWGEPLRVNAIFDKLLLSDRDGRQGFPLAVVVELSELRNYYHQRIIPTLVKISPANRHANTGVVGDEPSLGIATRRGTGFRL
ncbi:MAG: hypothetical protein K0B16_09060 [Burkholderiaceae bacterium]|nr:hypothetical protein [Burkholderiaceae bacterium]